MQKLILLFLFFPLVSFGQWTLSESNDPFDGKISLVKQKGFGGEFPYENPVLIIRYRHLSEQLDIYIDDLGYAGCSNNIIYASFNDNPDNVFSYDLIASKNNTAVFFKEKQYFELLSNLMRFSAVTIKFSNSCDDKRFKFNLNGSSNAINNLLEKTTKYNKKAQEENKKAEEEKLKKEKIKDLYVQKLINQAKEIADWKDSEITSLKNTIRFNYKNGAIYDSITVKPRSLGDFMRGRNLVTVSYYDKKSNKTRDLIGGFYKASINEEYLDKFYLDVKNSIENLNLKAREIKLEDLDGFNLLIYGQIDDNFGVIYKDVRFEPYLKPFDFFDKYGQIKTYLIDEYDDEVLLSSSLKVERDSPLFEEYNNLKKIGEQELSIKKEKIYVLLQKLKREDVIELVMERIIKEKNKSPNKRAFNQLTDINDISIEFFEIYGGKALDARVKLFLKNDKFVLINNLYLSLLDDKVDNEYLIEIGAELNKPF